MNSRIVRTGRRRLVGATLALTMLAVAAAVLGGLFSGHTATAQSGYTITVHARSTYGLGPDWINAWSPPLPAGWFALTQAVCHTVIVDGVPRPLAEVSGTLDAGQYQLADCGVGPEFYVNTGSGLVNIAGSTNAVGGLYRVLPTETELGVEGVLDSDENVVRVFAVVTNTAGESLTLEGAHVFFAYEDHNGVLVLNEDDCSLVTHFDPTAGFSYATCSIPAAKVLGGTGHWTASYAGAGNLGGSAAQGWIDGAAVDPAQAALNFAALSLETVQIIPQYIPPGCYIAPEPNSSLLMVSISVVSQDCAVLKALTTTTQVVLALMPIATGGTSLVLAKAAAIKGAAMAATIKAQEVVRVAVVSTLSSI